MRKVGAVATPRVFLRASVHFSKRAWHLRVYASLKTGRSCFSSVGSNFPVCRAGEPRGQGAGEGEEGEEGTLVEEIENHLERDAVQGAVLVGFEVGFVRLQVGARVRGEGSCGGPDEERAQVQAASGSM
jgi:hypothetical protein